MSLEQIYMKTDPDKVIRILTESFHRRSWSGGPSTPIEYVPLASRDFDKKRSRHFTLSTYPNGWIALVEAGDLADWELAQELARELGDPLLVISLHESMNAWAYAYFEQGKREDSVFRPQQLFSDIQRGPTQDENWNGDAWAEAHAMAEKYELPEPFLSYRQIAKNPRLSDRFLSFRRQEES